MRGRWPFQLPALLLALYFAAVFAWLALQRVGYPFELEWMEGGSLQHLQRVLAGKALYGPPSLDFVPYPYPPLYYYAGALLTPLFGAGFPALRGVSLLASCGSAWVIFAWVRRETGRDFLGLVCAGTFLATFRASGAYMDVARLDSLFVFLALLSLLLLRFARTRSALVGAGLCAAAAIMTKQTGVVLYAPILLWCLRADWREAGGAIAPGSRMRAFVLPMLGIVALSVVVLDGLLGQRFLWYVVGAQAAHEIRWSMLPGLVARDLVLALPLMSLLALGYAVLRARDAEASFFLALLVGAGLAYVIPRAKAGGAMNNLILIHACLIVAGGVAAGRVEGWMGAMAGWTERRGEAALALGLALQLLLLVYDPRIALPQPSDEAAGWRLVERLAALEGEVLMPAQGYLAVMAGKRSFAHQRPVDDLANSGLADAEALREEFAAAIRGRRFAAIVDSTSIFLQHYPDSSVLRESYGASGPVFARPRTLVPRSGWGVSPGLLWRPKAEPGSGAASRR
ncbi:MAG: glycosyltransferase family 39 protein [Deltaproteobacteria bacterium]|nr:glycosyltransferase family 39 protein [Deltaproteobacteria bacterium]MBW2419518.1 glycosyltransferase family 39 protein [Deltaproteobacteria bacterium]